MSQPKRRTLRKAKKHLPTVRGTKPMTGIYPGQKGKGCAVLTLLVAGATVGAAHTGIRAAEYVMGRFS